MIKNEKEIIGMFLNEINLGASEEFGELLKITHPKHFADNKVYQTFIEVLREYYTKYQSLPTYRHIIELLEKKAEEKRIPKKVVDEQIAKAMASVQDVEDISYIRESYVKFTKTQAWKNLYGSLVQKLDKGDDIDELISYQQKNLDELRLIGSKDSADDLEVVELDKVKPEEIDWLWFNRIPHGKFSLIVGDPGAGKSFFTLDMAAHVTRGESWTDNQPCKKGSVIILTAEDGVADTVRPRADAMEADVSKIKVIEGTKEIGEIRTFSFVKDIPRLEKLVEKLGDVRLIVIDPMSAYIGKLDAHKDAEVRTMLEPLNRLAEKHKVAIVGVAHFNKNEQSSVRYRVIGSIAWVAAARAVWAIGRVRDNENLRYFSPLKDNILVEPNSLTFTICENRVIFEPESSNIDLEYQLKTKGAKGTAPRRDEAEEFLLDILKDGGKESNEVFSAGEEAGITETTLRRAQKRLNIKPKQTGKNEWLWELPEK